ncbi:MAG: putative toxin-antitoxin system toxin component, PIN family [Gammaproteobacteria bacterium]|nr:putative toxin-antitoxin system toxin component, PIN family [Gammaproteobacteria bacterium]
MRLVLDTNVLIAAFISHGVCNELVEYCVLHHDVITSTFIRDEFQRTLIQKFKFPRADAVNADRLLSRRLIRVRPLKLDKPVCRDRDDDTILGTALAGNCRCVVTGDKDLLSLRRYHAIDILAPGDFWRYENA